MRGVSRDTRARPRQLVARPVAPARCDPPTVAGAIAVCSGPARGAGASTSAQRTCVAHPVETVAVLVAQRPVRRRVRARGASASTADDAFALHSTDAGLAIALCGHRIARARARTRNAVHAWTLLQAVRSTGSIQTCVARSISPVPRDGILVTAADADPAADAAHSMATANSPKWISWAHQLTNRPSVASLTVASSARGTVAPTMPTAVARLRAVCSPKTVDAGVAPRQPKPGLAGA